MGGSSSREDTIPVLTSVYVFMLIPTTVLLIAALLTSLLITNYDSLLHEECDSQVRAFLFGCLVLFYAWCCYHFYVLFGFAWKNLVQKLVVLVGFLLLMALWIVNGHLNLQVQVSEQCFGTVYHRMIIADLGCLYFFFGYLLVVVVLSAGGFCPAPGDAAYTAKMTRAQAQPLQGARPGAGVRTPMRPSRRVRDIDTQARDRDDQPASPLPLVEMLPLSGPSISRGDPLLEADELFAAKQEHLAGRVDREMDELDQLERSVLSNRGANPNEAPSPSHFRVIFDEHSQETDNPQQQPPPAQQQWTPAGTPARRQAQQATMPLTPRMH